MNLFGELYVWDVPPCIPLKVNRNFEESCCLHLQGRRISQARNQLEAGTSSAGFLIALF
jgi:hypothetical protein